MILLLWRGRSPRCDDDQPAARAIASLTVAAVGHRSCALPRRSTRCASTIRRSSAACWCKWRRARSATSARNSLSRSSCQSVTARRASRSRAIAAASSSRCGCGDRASQHGCTPSDAVGHGEPHQVLRRDHAADHQRGRDPRRARLHRRPAPVRGSCRRRCGRATRLAATIAPTGTRDVRILDLDQQIDARPLRPGEKFGEADQARLHRRRSPRRRIPRPVGPRWRDRAGSPARRRACPGRRIRSHRRLRRPPPRRPPRCSRRAASLLPRCATTCGFIDAASGSLRRRPRAPSRARPGVAGSVNDRVRRAPAFPARCRITCITPIGQQRGPVAGTW